jgi:preprotein translocase subunit SecB
MIAMNALLNLDEYFVDEIHVRVNTAYRQPDQEIERKSEIGSSITIKRKGTKPEFMIAMNLEINKPKEAFAVSAYYISLNIIGYFSFVEGTDEETVKKMIVLNGPVILYGVARGVVGQATGNCRFGKFVLPTLNFLEIMKKDAEKKQIKNKTNDRPIIKHSR